MAKKRGRPKQKNFFFFPHAAFAHQDRKLRKVMRKYGPTASAVWWEILDVIYHTEGYYCNVDNDLYEDVAEAIFCSDSNLVAQIISDFVKVELFDEQLFMRKGILTSEAIQRRVKKMAVWRDYQFNPELLLISLKPETEDDEQEVIFPVEYLRENTGEIQGKYISPKEKYNKTMEKSILPQGKLDFPSSKEKKSKVNNIYISSSTARARVRTRER